MSLFALMLRSCTGMSSNFERLQQFDIKTRKNSEDYTVQSTQRVTRA